MGSMLIICILDTAPIMDYRICNNTVFRLEEVIDFCEADLVFFYVSIPEASHTCRSNTCRETEYDSNNPH